MPALQLTVNSLHKAETEYHRKLIQTIGRISHISIMSRIAIFYTACRLTTLNVAFTLTGFQGIKSYIKYLYSQPHKPIFYPSNYYYGSNCIILTCSGNQV